MAFFYQHVGEEMARRDYPKSLGSRTRGALEFTVDELVSRFEIDKFCPATDIERLGRDGFTYQVWGLPRGAEKVVKDIRPGDSLMLLGSKVFDFIGTVTYRIPKFADHSSRLIWGESRFPIIVLLRNSCFLDLPFSVFSQRLGFDENYHMRGNTMKVGPARLRSSGFQDSDDLANWCRGKGAA